MSNGEKQSILVQFFSIVVVIVVIINFIFLAIGRIGAKTFWLIIIIAAFLAYIALPMTRKK